MTLGWASTFLDATTKSQSMKEKKRERERLNSNFENSALQNVLSKE